MGISSLHNAVFGCKTSKQHDSCQQEPKIFIYVASVEYSRVWFQIVTLEVQTFARSFCREELLPSGCGTAHLLLQVTWRGSLHRWASGGVFVCEYDVRSGWREG